MFNVKLGQVGEVAYYRLYRKKRVKGIIQDWNLQSQTGMGCRRRDSELVMQYYRLRNGQNLEDEIS
jgi:hypothetical protein